MAAGVGVRARLGGDSVAVAGEDAGAAEMRAGRGLVAGAAMAVCNLRIAIRVLRIAIRRPLCGCGVTEGWQGIGAWPGVVGKAWWIDSGPMLR